MKHILDKILLSCPNVCASMNQNQIPSIKKSSAWQAANGVILCTVVSLVSKCDVILKVPWKFWFICDTSIECGRSSSNVTTLIRGGHDALFGEFPWHVAIYDVSLNNSLICGGSIISPYAIISGNYWTIFYFNKFEIFQIWC